MSADSLILCITEGGHFKVPADSLILCKTEGGGTLKCSRLLDFMYSKRSQFLTGTEVLSNGTLNRFV